MTGSESACVPRACRRRRSCSHDPRPEPGLACGRPAGKDRDKAVKAEFQCAALLPSALFDAGARTTAMQRQRPFGAGRSTCDPGQQPTLVTGSFLASRLTGINAEAIANWLPERWRGALRQSLFSVETARSHSNQSSNFIAYQPSASLAPLIKSRSEKSASPWLRFGPAITCWTPLEVRFGRCSRLAWTISSA